MVGIRSPVKSLFVEIKKKKAQYSKTMKGEEKKERNKKKRYTRESSKR